MLRHRDYFVADPEVVESSFSEVPTDLDYHTESLVFLDS